MNKHEADAQYSFNSGSFDGQNAAAMKNMPHTKWPTNKLNKIVHFNKDYARGYIQGFKEKTGLDLTWYFAL